MKDALLMIATGWIALLWFKNKLKEKEINELHQKEFNDEIKATAEHINTAPLSELASEHNAEYLARKINK